MHRHQPSHTPKYPENGDRPYPGMKLHFLDKGHCFFSPSPSLYPEGSNISGVHQGHSRSRSWNVVSGSGLAGHPGCTLQAKVPGIPCGLARFPGPLKPVATFYLLSVVSQSSGPRMVNTKRHSLGRKPITDYISWHLP